MMKLSVAMCTYNGVRFLERQLESIAAQTVTPNELIVVDDASSDSTVELLHAFAKTASFPVAVHVNQANRGSTASFESAVRFCTGDIIVLCDQDDVWLPNKLEVISAAFETGPDVAYVFSDAELVNEDLVPLDQALWQSFSISSSFLSAFNTNEQLQFFLLRPHFVTGAAMAFHSSLKEFIFPFPVGTIWLHDAWIAMVASCIGVRGLALSEKLILYRIHPKQQAGVPAVDRATIRSRYKAFKSERASQARKWREVSQSLRHLESHLVPYEKRQRNVPVALPRVREAAVHSHNRATIITSTGYAKYLLLLQESFSGRYSRFGNSFKSVLCDILS